MFLYALLTDLFDQITCVCDLIFVIVPLVAKSSVQFSSTGEDLRTKLPAMVKLL